MQIAKSQFKIKNKSLKDKRYTLKAQTGVATLEMLIAMTLIVLVISAVLPLVSGGQSASVDSQTNQEALYKAQALIEDARATSRVDFASVVTSASVNEDIYTKNITVTDIDSSTKQVTSNVTWNTNGRNLAVNLSTLLTNPVLGGDTCSPVLTGDWVHPQILGHTDIISNEGGSDLKVLSKKLYLTSNPAAAGQSDFFVFDVNDPTNPVDISSGGINTGPGLEAVHVAGKYAYVANTSVTNQLQVIDISLPTTPTEIVSARRDVVTLPGDTAVGNSIFYSDRKIYLGLTKSDGPEFYIFDVTNPTSPIQLGSGFETNTLISQIYVKDDVAYIATPDDFDTSSVVEHLRILDVSNPATVSEISSYGESNAAIQDGKSLFYKDGVVYLGRASDDNTRDELIILDVINPSSITRLGGKSIEQSPPPRSWSINAIILRSNLVFIITKDGPRPNSEFQIWDASNPSNIIPYSEDLDITQASTGGMDCEGNILYIAQRSSRALQVIGPGP